MSEFEMIELKRTEPTSNESIKNLHGQVDDFDDPDHF